MGHSKKNNNRKIHSNTGPHQETTKNPKNLISHLEKLEKEQQKSQKPVEERKQ